MNVLVLFGSKSDSYVYEPLCKDLEKSFNVDFEVISAHRDPARLHTRLNEDNFDLIVAGAGLAAHLPGVCASLTKKPVFGVPVNSQLGGLDSLLSIIQMPYGIPVGTLAPTSCLYLREWLDNFLKLDINLDKPKMNLVIDNSRVDYEFYSNELKRLLALTEELNFEVIKSEAVNTEMMNIRLIPSFDKFENFVAENTINNFVLELHEKNNPMNSSKYVNRIDENLGVYTGISNTRNSLLFWNKLVELRRSL
tara:strand:- start:38232 stop:38984 length:753 start_codon:yes stop_codon:yes gene_type:complete